jgi:trk system potassium uptake protein TrkA
MMANTKHFVVIGLGTFGAALASRLARNGCRVTGVDSSQENVEELKDSLYEAIIGDATERETLEHLPLQTADAVFISMGEDITRSLLATLHAKELGARRIIVKGVTPEHGKILARLGVDRVVYPEIEIARQLADQFTWPNIVDLLPLGADYNFVEIAVPDAFVGKTLQEIDLRRRLGVFVVGVKDAMTGNLDVLPSGDYRLGADQILLVVGRSQDLNRLRNWS